MAGYLVLSLSKFMAEEKIPEEDLKKFLSGFYCPLNKDVEIFLQQKAIEFEKQSISRTYLV